MKLEEAKKLRNIFKSNLNEISRGRFKLLFKSREAIIKLNLSFVRVYVQGVLTGFTVYFLHSKVKHIWLMSNIANKKYFILK